MVPMDPQDARINMQVKAILISRYIDTSKVNYFTTRGVVYLQGSVIQLKGGRAVLKSEIDNILDNITRLSGVKDVVNDLIIVELKKQASAEGLPAAEESMKK